MELLSNSVITVIASLLSGVALFAIEILIGRSSKRVELPNYSERLDKITSRIKQATKEVDSLLVEFSDVAEHRERSISKLEMELNNLELREAELKNRITALEGVSVPAAEQFAKLTEIGEKRSARRDYLLFAAGAVVSFIFSLIFS